MTKPKKPAKPKKSAAERPLTPRQERFVAEYLIDLNATQAAIRAGYAAKDADVQGPRLLGIVRISTAIAKAKAARNERTEITQDRVLAELALLAFSDHTHYEVDEKGTVKLAPHAPSGAHRAIASVKRRINSIGGEDADAITTAEVEIKLWDKPGPLKLAGRHVGLFPDKIEVTGKDGKPLAVAGPQIVLYLPENGRDVKPPAPKEHGDAATGDDVPKS